jgi:hypothetical protein
VLPHPPGFGDVVDHSIAEGGIRSAREVVVILFLILSGSCHDPGCATSEPDGSCSRVSDRQSRILAFWEDQSALIRSQPDQVFDQPEMTSSRAYPAENAQLFLAAYLVTGRSQYLEDARRQLDYARASETAEHLHRFPADLDADTPPEGFVSSLAQARLALGYFVAFKATRSQMYLRWAEQAVVALLLLPRAEQCHQSRCFQRHYYLYSLVAPYTPYPGTQLDPNQQAFIGLAMTLLYHEPRSRLRGNEELRTLALDQLEGALALMDSTGRLPLGQHAPWSDLFDTRYGCDALFLTMWANTHWKRPDLDSLLAKGTRWLWLYTDGVATTSQEYPLRYEGPPNESMEMYCRLALMHRYGGDIGSLQRALDDVWSKPALYTEHRGGWTTPFAVLPLVGLSLAEYWR